MQKQKQTILYLKIFDNYNNFYVHDYVVKLLTVANVMHKVAC